MTLAQWESLRVKLEARIVEILSMPVECLRLDFDADRTYAGRVVDGFFVLSWRGRDRAWYATRLQVSAQYAEDAVPFADEPPLDFIEAHTRWVERDAPFAANREQIAQAFAYRVTK